MSEASVMFEAPKFTASTPRVYASVAETRRTRSHAHASQTLRQNIALCKCHARGNNLMAFLTSQNDRRNLGLRKLERTIELCFIQQPSRMYIVWILTTDESKKIMIQPGIAIGK